MNIICNSCVGGFIYKNELKCSFKNPFIWNIIDFNSMYYMAKNYDQINFENYELTKDKNWNFSLIIDGKIKINYVHYKFDPNAKTIKVDNKTDKEEEWIGDVYYCKIWEFIYQKYEERTKRMLALNEEPCFLIRDESFANANSKHSIKDIAYCNSPYKRIIITTDKSITRNDDICKTIHVDKIEVPLPTILHNIKTIKEFF